MKERVLLAKVLIVIILMGCKSTYKLPDAKMKPIDVCGSDYCLPGNPPGIIFHFYQKPYAPQVNENTSAQEIAYSVIGQVFKEGDMYGSIPFDCSPTEGMQPFKQTDIVPLISRTGRNFDYVKTEKLEIDIEAATQANMDEIKKLSPANVNLPKVEAEIRAKYASLNDKQSKVVGRYSEWSIDRNVFQKIRNGEDFKACREYLRDNNLRMITTIGLVYFDIDVDNKSIDAITSELQAEIEKHGIEGNIAFAFKREISQSLKASTKEGYQILVWRHAGYNDLVI